MTPERIKEIFGDLDPFEETEEVTKDIAPLWWYLDSRPPEDYDPQELREVLAMRWKPNES